MLIEQNTAFDVGFLLQMMNYAGLIPEFEKCFSGTTNYYGNFQPYLYRHAAHRPFGIRRRCGGHLLQARTDCGTFFFWGGGVDDAHDAAADVTATLDILGVYTSRRRNAEGIAGDMVQKKEKTRKYFKV